MAISCALTCSQQNRNNMSTKLDIQNMSQTFWLPFDESPNIFYFFLSSECRGNSQRDWILSKCYVDEGMCDAMHGTLSSEQYSLTFVDDIVQINNHHPWQGVTKKHRVQINLHFTSQTSPHWYDQY